MAVAALGIGLTACGGPGQEPKGLTGLTTSPSPVTSPTPTQTPEPDPEQVHIQDATDAYLAHVDAWNAIGLSGFADPAPALLMLGSDVEYNKVMMDEALDKRARGVVQVGEQTAAKVDVKEYIPDPSGFGGERVVFDVCIDQTGFDLVNPDGTSILADDGLDRRPATVTLEHQRDRWLVHAVEWQRGQTC